MISVAGTAMLEQTDRIFHYHNFNNVALPY